MDKSETNSVNTVNNNAKANKQLVPTNYKCFNCKKRGDHWLKNCPSTKESSARSSPNQEKVKELHRTLSGFKNTVENTELGKTCKDIESELDRYRNENKEIVKNREEIRKKLNDISQKRVDRMNALVKENNEVKSVNKELNVTLDEVKQNEEGMKTELENERKKNEQLLHDKNKLTASVEEYNLKIKEIETELNNKINEMNKFEGMNKELKLTKIQEIEKNEELTKRCDSLKQERNYNKNVYLLYEQELINKYDEIEIQNIEQTKMKLNDMKMLNDQLFKKLKQRNDKNKALESSMNDLKQKYDKTVMNYDKKLELENEKYNQLLSKYNQRKIVMEKLECNEIKSNENDDEKLEVNYINGGKDVS